MKKFDKARDKASDKVGNARKHDVYGTLRRTIVLAITTLTTALQLQAAPREVPPADIEKIREAAPEQAPAEPAKPRRILVYSETTAFYHASIPWAEKAMEILGEKSGAFEATVSNDLDNFMPENLAQYDAVVLNNTTGELFVPARPKAPPRPNRKRFKSDEEFEKAEAKWQEQKAAYDERMKSYVAPEDCSKELRASLMNWLKSGKGLVGIHAATDCSYKWAEFGEMIGGYFTGHPWHEKVTVKNDDPDSPINAAFGGEGFKVIDEIYQFNKGMYSREKQRVLLSLDMNGTSNKGKREDQDYAISWIKHHGEGRVFYCSLGHRNEIFWNPKILAHYLAGIQWAIGDLQGVEAAPNPLP